MYCGGLVTLVPMGPYCSDGEIGKLALPLWDSQISEGSFPWIDGDRLQNTGIRWERNRRTVALNSYNLLDLRPLVEVVDVP